MSSSAPQTVSVPSPALPIGRNVADDEIAPSSPKRGEFQNALIDAERGFSQGFRASSVLYVYFFIGLIVLICGLIFQFNWLHWSAATLALSFTVTAEMFQLLLRRLAERLAILDPTFRANQWRLAAAGVFVARLGAILVIGTAVVLQIRRLI